MTYTTYITRDNKEYEVTAELYDEGEGYTEFCPDSGYYLEILKNPEFYKFYTEYDDSIEEFIFTPEEIQQATSQLIEQYWDNF